MTISTTTVRIAYDGDNVTTTFAVPFAFFAASELEVIERNIALGTETPKVLGTHYTVAGGDGASGTVTASAAPSSAVQWVVRRKTARTQATDYTPNDPFPAETHEKALDRLTMIGQELGEESDRAMTFPKTDAIGLSPVLPASVARAGRVLAFDGTGVPTVSTKTLAQLENEADNAAASAAAAASSASAASSSATAAATSATSAATSATAASTSAVIAAAAAEKNVKSYGAVGDGVTDDTAAFTAAIAAAGGGVLVVPEGTFIVTGITINVALELRLRRGATIKQKANTNANLITVSHSDVTIRGGALDGNKANQSTFNAAILSNSNDRILVDGVWIASTKGCGIYFSDGDDLIVRNCRFTATVGTSVQYFCTAKNVNRAVAEGNLIDRSDDATYNDGCVKMTNNSGGTSFGFIGCRINNNRAAMSPAASGTNIVIYEIWAGGKLANRNCAITDNYAAGGGTSCSINGGINCLIEGNTAYNFNSVAFELADCVNSGIVGNAADGNVNGGGGAAINDDSGVSKNNRIADNTLKQCVRAVYVAAPGCIVSNNDIYENTHEGIEINGPGNDGAIISGNHILTATQNSSFAGIVNINNSDVTIIGNRVKCVGNGIQLLGTTGTVDRIGVIGNTSRSSAVGEYNWTGSNFGTNIIVSNNQGYSVGGIVNADWFDIKTGNLIGVRTGTPNEDVGASIVINRSLGVGGSAYVKEATGGSNWFAVQTIHSNTTANRPASPANTGFMDYDTDLAKPIWWNGSSYVQADGLAAKGKSLEASKTYDAPSLATSSTTTTTVAVTGAAPGDYAQASFGVDLQGIICTAYVSSADTVTVVLLNPTGGSIDLGSTTLRVRVAKL